MSASADFDVVIWGASGYVGRIIAERFESGEGPDQVSGDAASYAIQLIGSDGTDRRVSIVVTGQGDPGYRSSARIVTEVVHSLVEDGPAAEGGFWTPGALLGGRLVDRLAAAAGLTFVS
jgi:short subunit dehydrogenase-like uncharacterized protein